MRNWQQIVGTRPAESIRESEVMKNWLWIKYRIKITFESEQTGKSYGIEEDYFSRYDAATRFFNNVCSNNIPRIPDKGLVVVEFAEKKYGMIWNKWFAIEFPYKPNEESN